MDPTLLSFLVVGFTRIPNPTVNFHRAALACVFAFVTSLGAFAAETSAITDDDTFFIDQVEPLLKTHCYGCHSHAAGEMEGGLTLDSRSGWEIGGASGPAVIPHQPQESLIIQAILHQDDDLRMPPDEKLSKDEIDLITDWIRRGAHDPRVTDPSADQSNQSDPNDWWSLRALVRPPVPKSQPPQSHPIDAFVQQQLDANDLIPLPPVDRRALIRRVMFDLHGLPPTPGDVANFIADPDPMAYEKLVDRLLQSPRYGERWGRHWLDSIHFADSHGCEHDLFRPSAWRYRDYVIESFNRDTPWPRFIREQLAADRFFPDEPALTAALGFIAAGPLELSRASTAPITFDYLDRDDMVTQTMAALASTTANCARCHDHKFDPITQSDYYSVQAVFAGVGKGDVEFDEDSNTAFARRRWTDLAAKVASGTLQQPLDAELRQVVTQWETQLRTQPTKWEPLIPATFVSSDGADLKRLSDHSLLVMGIRPDKDTTTITAPIPLAKLTAIRLDVLGDESLPAGGPGRADNGNLHLTELEAFVFDSDSAEPRRLKVQQAVSDWDQAGWTITHALDGDPKTAWGIFPKVGSSHQAVFQLQSAQPVSPSSQIVIILKQLHGGSHLIGRLKLAVTDAEHPTGNVVPERVGAAVRIPPNQRSAEQQNAIDMHVLRIHAKRQLADLPPMSSVYAVSNRYSHSKKLDQPLTPKVVHVLKRGNIDLPGEVAMPGALSCIEALPDRFVLPDPQDEPARRAAFADWLAAPENPLTWRSIVNRVWTHHFGRGICDTPDDFGRMGGVPSHPELIDYLAVWFRDDADGSVKQLHRLILLSSAYQRQSNVVAADAVSNSSIDRNNRLLWRMNRRRLDAESFRDAVLQISGRIDLAMGGPGIEQFTQSKGAQDTPQLDYDAYDWGGPSAARRSVYRVVWRGIADPFMDSLDFPDLGLLAPQRDSSVSALQALVLYNNDFVLHHSQTLADRLRQNQPTIDQQIAEAVRLIHLRQPSQREHDALVGYAAEHGLAATCRVLFNSNEFMFVD